jgi:hypothetical protein
MVVVAENRKRADDTRSLLRFVLSGDAWRVFFSSFVCVLNVCFFFLDVQIKREPCEGMDNRQLHNSTCPFILFLSSLYHTVISL